MLSYGGFFTLAGFAVRDTARARGWRRLAAIGVVVPFFALAAATFDASENIALLLTLAGNGGSLAPPFAAVCSAIKFTLIVIAILYAFSGLTVRPGHVSWRRADPLGAPALPTSRHNPQPTRPCSRQTRASPTAERAVSSGFRRQTSHHRPAFSNRRIPLNHAENGLRKPKKGHRAKGVENLASGFQDRRIQPLCHPSRGNDLPRLPACHTQRPQSSGQPLHWPDLQERWPSG